ncbi:hypothetical protein K435DRAFT_940433, partial [Dendrothele bispora CBS 962.96]
NRFVRLVKSTSIPDRKELTYNKCIRRRHAAILGITTLIQSFPYTVEKWMPELLAIVLAEYVSDSIPISTAVENGAVRPVLGKRTRTVGLKTRNGSMIISLEFCLRFDGVVLLCVNSGLFNNESILEISVIIATA